MDQGVKMGLRRRDILFGGALLGVGSAIPTEAAACSQGIRSVFSIDYWLGPFARIAAGRKYRGIARNFVEAILAGDLNRLDSLLSTNARMLLLPDMVSADTNPSRIVGRAKALALLSDYVSRQGSRDYRINGFETLTYMGDLLLDVTLSGYGEATIRRGKAHVVNPYVFCGEGLEWSRRLVARIDISGDEPDISNRRIRSIILLN
jgi:hypothetical protein